MNTSTTISFVRFPILTVRSAQRWPSISEDKRLSETCSDCLLTGFRLVFADSNDDVDSILRCSIQVVVDYLLDTVGISDLGVEGGSGVVRNHSVATTKGVLHGPPGVIAGSRLDIPDISGVSAELTTVHSLGDCVFVADRTTSGVH